MEGKEDGFIKNLLLLYLFVVELAVCYGILWNRS